MAEHVEMNRESAWTLIMMLEFCAQRQMGFWTKCVDTCEKEEDIAFVVGQHDIQEAYSKEIHKFYPSRNRYVYVSYPLATWERIQFFVQLYGAERHVPEFRIWESQR